MEIFNVYILISYLCPDFAPIYHDLEGCPNFYLSSLKTLQSSLNQSEKCPYQEYFDQEFLNFVNAIRFATKSIPISLDVFKTVIFFPFKKSLYITFKRWYVKENVYFRQN